MLCCNLLRHSSRSYTGEAKVLHIVGPLLGMRIRGGNMDGGNASAAKSVINADDVQGVEPMGGEAGGPQHSHDEKRLNSAMLLEDEERRQYEMESAFSELPTGYDDDDERALERDFGDTLTDEELTDSHFSAAAGDFPGPNKEAAPASPVPAATAPEVSVVTGAAGEGARKCGEPPEELIPGPRWLPLLSPRHSYNPHGDTSKPADAYDACGQR